MSNITMRIMKSVLLAAALIVTVSATAQAQPFRHGGFGVRVGPRIGIGFGGFYNPFWGPYYPYWGYGTYPYVAVHPTGWVRVKGVPKETQVFVDGYLAGTAGTVATTPGGHTITLFLPGYRTVTQNVYVRPGSTFKMNDTMERLGAGGVSAPPPAPASPVKR
jgi:hypothetical protein